MQSLNSKEKNHDYENKKNRQKSTGIEIKHYLCDINNGIANKYINPFLACIR